VVFEDNKKLEISMFLATTSGGPATDFEAQMREYCFNKTRTGWFSSGGITHPKSNTGLGAIGSPWMISLNYYYKSDLLMGAIYSENPIGRTWGYDDNKNDLNIYYSVNTLTAMARYKYENLIICLGPSILFTKAYKDEIQNGNENHKGTKIGFVAEVGIAYPEHSAFFVSMIAQYRFVGDVNVGPFEAGDQKNNSLLPVLNINYNHLFVGFGAGIRF